MENDTGSELVPQSESPPPEIPGKCNAVRPGNKRCKRPAGHNTPHPGAGRCARHGGRTPIKSGRYSNLHHLKIGARIEHYENDPDPLNIMPELALLRALTEDYIDRYEKFVVALFDWHESYVRRPLDKDRVDTLSRVLDEYEDRLRRYEEPTVSEMEALALSRDTVERLVAAQQNKPRSVLDLTAAKELVAETTKVVERIEKIRSQDAISRPELLRAMTHMGRVVNMWVTDPHTLDKIRQGWSEMIV